MPVHVSEKRRSPRIPIKVGMRYLVRGAGDSHNLVADDLSATGASFTNGNFLAPNTCLSFQINVLSRIISPTGRVVWSQPIPHSDRYRAGIEFIEMNPAERTYLGDYIHLHLHNDL